LIGSTEVLFKITIIHPAYGDGLYNLWQQEKLKPRSHVAGSQYVMTHPFKITIIYPADGDVMGDSLLWHLQATFMEAGNLQWLSQ
jgi:hypothetical protein